jgi:hypothetical protein
MMPICDNCEKKVDFVVRCTIGETWKLGRLHGVLDENVRLCKECFLKELHIKSENIDK